MKLGSQAMLGNREPLIFLESDRIRYALKKDHCGSCVMEKLEWVIQGNQLGSWQNSVSKKWWGSEKEEESFINVFHKLFLSVCCVPGTTVGIWDMADILILPSRPIVQWVLTGNQQISI